MDFAEYGSRLFWPEQIPVDDSWCIASVEPGRDADLLVLDGDLGLVEVFARGKRLMAGGKLLARGTFSA